MQTNPQPTVAAIAARRPSILHIPSRLGIFAGAVRDMVSDDDRDLTLRQIAVLLTVHAGGPNTVRGLAHALCVAKPAITRAADRLGHLCLVERRPDPGDRRSVLLVVTFDGRVFVETLEARLARFPLTGS